MSFYLDLTEFLVNPITTGIQRITGEICRYSPPGMAFPVCLTSQGFVALSPALIDAIGSYFGNATPAAAQEIRRLGGVQDGSVIELSPDDTVLVPEVFDDPQRVSFFRQMSDRELQRYRFVVYDLLPVTHPEYFIPENLLRIYGYFRTLRRATHCGFISEDTRDVYYGRLKRTSYRGGVVLPLGCDALGPRVSTPQLNRPLTFSVLGTVEPRKNHKLILEAFEPLLREYKSLKLSFLGKMGWIDSGFAQRVETLASDPTSGFQFHSVQSDAAIRSYIEQSRATIYVSTAEGYGLPPVESLWLGTPVIASTTIPSLKRLGSAGIHYVNPLTVSSLRSAVLTFLDDAYANQKIQETAQLTLPTWRSFTEEVLRWCAPAPTTHELLH